MAFTHTPRLLSIIKQGTAKRTNGFEITKLCLPNIDEDLFIGLYFLFQNIIQKEIFSYKKLYFQE